jgi:SNF2 family DNA or RNA helicase
MIIQHTADNQLILFQPEDLAERKKLDSFPGLTRQGLQFYCPNKQHIFYNLYQRLRLKFKRIKYTPAIQEMVEDDLVIKELPSWFKFHTEPLKHQLIALRFAYTFGSFLNLSEPGLGKTKVTLDFIWLIRAVKSLIVCPKALRFVWEEEAVKHRPELSVYVVETTDWDKELPKVKAADVVVVNYDKAVALEEALKGLQFDFMAVDEGLIKNPSTERTKALTRLSRGIKYRCVMSGTLVNNSPLDVFAPLRFIEPSLVGESFTKFRDEYALMTALGKGGYGPRIVTGFKRKEEVRDMLASCGVIMTKKEWLVSLPPKEFIHKYVTMGDQQRDYYLQLASNYLLQIPEINTEVEVDNPLSVLIKLNQISNGFLYYKENTEETLNDLYGTESRKGSKGVRKTYFFEEQPKAKALLKLISSEEFNSPNGEPVQGSSNKKSVDPGLRRGHCEHRGDVRHSDSDNVQPDDTRDVPCGRRVDSESFEDCSRSSTTGSGVPTNALRDSSVDGDSESRRDLHEHRTSSGTGTAIAVCRVSDQCRRVERIDEPASSCGDCDSRVIPDSSGDRASPSQHTNSRSPTKRSDRRAIIWFNLEAERSILEQNLTEAGISFLTIAGGCKDVGGTVRRFNSDPTIRFLLCQAKTINYGVTIMGTKEEDLGDDVFPEFDPQISDEIFYSLNFSLEVFLQQQDRIHRIGQTRKCRYWILLTNSKIERRIADRLEEKLICNREILVDIALGLDKDMLEVS